MRKLCVSILLLGSIAALHGTAGDDFKLEPGFTLLFNGKDLDGWKEKKKDGAALDGKTEAFKGRFKVADSKLVIDPSVKGDVVIETQKAYGKDVVIKFEFKPSKGCNNDLWFRGVKFDLYIKVCKNMKDDEWNQFEIISTGDMLEYKCNGETQRTNKTKVESTPFGIRAENGPVEIRRVRIKS